VDAASVVSAEASGSWTLPTPYDFFATTRGLITGVGDPTFRREPDGFWRATHTPDGPAAVRLTVGRELSAEAWGPGARAALDHVPHWVGLHEPAWTLPPHPVVDRLLKAQRGLRGTDTRNVFEALVVTVLQQLVTWQEAATAWRRICRALGEPAPGPAGLWLPPTPRALRSGGTGRLHALGVGLKQARALMEVAFSARALQQAADMPTVDAVAWLQRVRGIGPWTANLAMGDRLGRPEPIPVGDFHLPHTVAWALAGEPRANDARMIELLEPFAGQAFRVIRLIGAAGIEAPKRGPRRAMRRY
jgi:3-methyladenine DNA glycosylase/8-oxoguanine DNA glycosylase